MSAYTDEKMKSNPRLARKTNVVWPQDPLRLDASDARPLRDEECRLAELLRPATVGPKRPTAPSIVKQRRSTQSAGCSSWRMSPLDRL